jgi:microcystin-dependent protein
MTIATPTWLQNGTYSAKRDRQVIAATWDEGVRKPLSFKVSQKAGGANYSVDVAAGEAIVQGDDEPAQGNYLVQSDAVANVVWPAPPGSNSRIDILVLQVNDPTAGGAAGDNAVLSVVQGTPAASPTAPTIPDSALPLCQITIVASQTVINDGNIIDLRVIAGQVDNVGVMKPYTGGPDAPSNYIWADGIDKVRADWPELHELYASQGYPYGSGDGSSTFGIPAAIDGRSVVGAGTGFTVGTESGTTTKTISSANLPTHVHSTPNHSHTMTHGHTAGSGNNSVGHTHSGTTGGTTGTQHNHGFSFNTLNAGAFEDNNVSSDHGGSVVGTLAGNTSIVDLNFHTHSFGTGGASASHTHTITVNDYTGSTVPNNGGDTGNGGFANSALDVMNPYVVIEGWIIRAA